MVIESAQRIKALTDKINDTTGESDKTLSAAVDRAIEGYGKGGFSNGTEWTKCLGVDGNVYCSVYANGLWLLGSDTGIYTSRDGINFTAALKLDPYNTGTTKTSYTVEKIVYADGVFVAYVSESYMGDHDGDGFYDYGEICAQIYSSTDGETWSWRISGNGPTTIVNDILYGNGMWVVPIDGDIGYSHVVYSENGINWISVPFDNLDGTPIYEVRAAYADGMFILACDNGVFYSEDGKNWSVSNLTFYDYLHTRPVRAGGVWVIACGHGVYTSVDGKSWVSGSITESAIAHYDNGMLVINTQDKLWHTKDAKGDQWATMLFSDTTGTLYPPFCVNGTWYISKGKAIYRFDGESWGDTGLKGSNRYRYLGGICPRYSSGIYLIVENDVNLYYSLDGINWTLCHSGANINDITCGGGMWHLCTSLGAYYSEVWKGE